MDDPISRDILSAVSEEYIGPKRSLFITRCVCLFSVSFTSQAYWSKWFKRRRFSHSSSFSLCPPQSKIVDTWCFEECGHSELSLYTVSCPSDLACSLHLIWWLSESDEGKEELPVCFLIKFLIFASFNSVLHYLSHHLMEKSYAHHWYLRHLYYSLLCLQ